MSITNMKTLCDVCNELFESSSLVFLEEHEKWVCINCFIKRQIPIKR